MSNTTPTGNDGPETDSIFSGGPSSEEAPMVVPEVRISKASGNRQLRADADQAEQDALEAEAERFRLEAEGADPALAKKAEANRQAKKAEATRSRKLAAAEAKKTGANRNGPRAVPEAGGHASRPEIDLDDEPRAVEAITAFLESDSGPDVYLGGTDL